MQNDATCKKSLPVHLNKIQIKNPIDLLVLDLIFNKS